MQEEKNVHGLLTGAASESAAPSSLKAMCHIYCALCDDRTRPHFIAEDEMMQRDELDACNSDNRPSTLCQQVADLVNEDVVCELPSNPDLHSVFAEPLCLDVSVMLRKITAKDVKRRLADC